MTYRKPWLVRAFCVIMCLLFTVVAPLFFWQGMIQEHEGNFAVLAFITLPGIGVSVPLFWMSGPDDITFNLEQRTYRRVWGWPFFAKTRTGTWKDLEGVFIGRGQGNISRSCAGVTWYRGDDYMKLGMYSDQASAEQFAKDLMTKLELPQVMPPPKLRPQGQARS